MNPKLQKPKILKEQMIFESRKFRIFEQELQFPDGHRETWEFVEPKWQAGIQVLAITDREELVLVREYRGAAERFVLRFPTGSLEDGEDPYEGARRELEEETGFRPGQLELVEERKSSSSYYRGMLYVFFATQLQQGTLQRDRGEQNMEVVLLPLQEAFQKAIRLEMDNPNTIYSILMAKKIWDQKKGETKKR